MFTLFSNCQSRGTVFAAACPLRRVPPPSPLPLESPLPLSLPLPYSSLPLPLLLLPLLLPSSPSSVLSPP
jgi:hypothetical protein